MTSSCGTWSNRSEVIGKFKMLYCRFISNCLRSNLFSTCTKCFCTIQNGFTNQIEDSTRNLLRIQVPNLYNVKRFKHKKKEILPDQNEVLEDDVDKNEDVSDLVEPYEKVFTRVVPSMRLDAIIKAGLGMARNKVDVAFYESKIRVNGKRVLKKGIEINDGDEIDLLVGKSPDNPNFIIIHRLRVVTSDSVSAGSRVKLVKDKSLVIEDYNDGPTSS